MANRSYIYSISFDRTKRKRENLDKVIALSEFNYAIPLSYKILVSQNPQLSNSFIWELEKPIAILGDFKKGKEKLFLFLEILKTKNIFDPEQLNAKVEITKEFFNTPDKT